VDAGGESLDGLDPSTLAVTAGRGAKRPGDPVNVAVPFTSTYRAGGSDIYGRDSNAVWSAFEEAIGALEGGDAVCFSSGLAAVAAVASLVPVDGVVVAPLDAYKGARTLFQELASSGRVAELRTVDITDTAATLAACEGASLLWAESPTNPVLGLADLGAFRGAAPIVAVDNTFATPLLQRPLDICADIVVHSATKMLAGHSDVVLGVAISRSAHLVERMRHHRTMHGAIAGPMETFLALRGLRTLPVRLERASATAAELVRRLTAHDAVEEVRYPGFGNMVAVTVKGGAAAADCIERAVRLIVTATSLGGVETTLERRGKYTGEERTPPGMLRVSVGLEHVDDLWNDFAQALGQLT
jgi:cystathionine gamma-synthase